MPLPSESTTSSTLPDGWLIESERELELEAIDLGVKRYREWRAKGNLGRPEQDLASSGMDRVRRGLDSIRQQVVTGNLTVGAGFLSWGPVLTYIPTDMLAGAALLATLEAFIHSSRNSGTSQPELPSVQDVTRGIGNAVETMFQLLKAKEMDKDLYNILSKTIKHWDGRRAKRFYSKVTGLRRAFTLNDRLRIGGFLLDHVLTTGWFTIEGQRDRMSVLVMDPEVSSELAKAHDRAEVMNPMLYPMVIPPAPWNQGKSKGGYIYHQRSIFKPVNPGDKPPNLNEAPAVWDAMDRINQTKWSINKPVLSVMEELWREGGDVGGLPRLEPHDVEREVPRLDSFTEEQLRENKRQRNVLHKANAMSVGSRLEMLWRLRSAHRMGRYPCFYQVWQMDWRGRVYPVASVLSPQGCDVDRGLLQFAEPVPQTPEGSTWLSIHLANCWANDGVDKAPYPSRIEWVKQHDDRIRAVVSDPLRYRWWLEAENPWMFLAACFEQQRNDNLTQLCISVDGSCNGLQHYSALGLDPIGAAAVNLQPSDRPQDIYENVAGVVRALLAASIERPPLPPITRKLVKRAVMTLPYGLTPLGMRDQFIEDGHMNGMPDPFKSATFLRDLVQQGIGQVVVKAVEMMGWLKDMAKEANALDMPLQWVTPLGMLVTQDYVVPDVITVKLPGLGQAVFERPPEHERRLYRLRQLNGICPNFVHSLDASHMMMTLNACWAEGLRHFWFIHDSFGTYAPQVPVLARVLREQLVAIYKEDQLEKFKKHNEGRLHYHLPPAPSRGTFDINEVLVSPYAFG